MTGPLSMENLPAELLRAVLNVESGQLTQEQSFEVYQFVERIGGVENAELAADMLCRLEDDAAF